MNKKVGKSSVHELTEMHERDHIFMMLIYALVYKHWQKNKDRQKRGHNIGALLVNKSGNIAGAELNRITSTKDLTQHAEVGLIQAFISNSKKTDLKGLTMYTTLEPCPMCSGMMSMTLLDRLVFGQSDMEFGGTFEKIYRETENYPSFPLQTKSEKSNDPVSTSLDKAFTQSDKHIITFLYSKDAKMIIEEAARCLSNHSTEFKRNSKILAGAIDFLDKY